MTELQAKFGVGQLIFHRLFDYRGVVVDVDPEFEGTEEWYESVAQSRPPKDRPWYHVLVHDSEHATYVAERNLEPYEGDEAVDNPEIVSHFAGFKNGHYLPLRPAN